MRPLAEIIEALLPSYPEMDAGQRRQIGIQVCRDVNEQVDRMPRYLGRPYRITLQVFDLLAVMAYGRRFRALGLDSRRSYLQWWSASPLSPMRDFVKVIRSMALLFYFDHPLVVGHLTSRQGCRSGEQRA